MMGGDGMMRGAATAAHTCVTQYLLIFTCEGQSSRSHRETMVSLEITSAAAR